MNQLGFETHWSFAHAIKARSDGSTCTPRYERAMLRYIFHKNARIFARRENQLEGEKEPYFDGIIHGHTHTVSERRFNSEIDKKTGKLLGPPEIICYDTGHWTGRPTNKKSSPDESWRDKLKHRTCTTLVEHFDGRMELIEWR